MSRWRDTSTLDLFRDVAPAPMVSRFAPEDVRAWKLSRNVTLTSYDGTPRVALKVAERIENRPFHHLRKPG